MKRTAAEARPYAKAACEALEMLGHADLVAEVKRRQGVLERAAMQEVIPFDFEGVGDE